MDENGVTRANLRPTPILDYESASIQSTASRLSGTSSELNYLQAAHRFISAAVAPVYTVDELQPASRTLEKRRGSCSQRYACLESLARAKGIGTRVRGFWVAGRFWSPRFRLTHPFIPRRILLAWPQFYVQDTWLGAETLFGRLDRLALRSPSGFTNDGESLFDAIAHTAVDFGGETAGCAGGRCDLSGVIVGDAGIFSCRDDLFHAFPLFQRSLRGIAFELIFGGRKSV